MPSQEPMFSEPTVASAHEGIVEAERADKLTPRGPEALAATEPGNLLELAINRGVPVETIERLAALYERRQDKMARASYFNALAAFQREHQIIKTDRKAKIATSGGGSFDVAYASLVHLVRELQGPLASHGFSFSWSMTVNESGAMVTASFILRHIDGHEERNDFTCPTESRAGMSPQMKYGSSESYAKRRSMLDGLGLVTDEDAGGEVAEKQRDAEKVSAEQAAMVRAMRDELSQTQRERFDARWPNVEEIPASQYGRVVSAMEAARGKK